MQTNGPFELAGLMLCAHMVYTELKCTGLCKKFNRQKYKNYGHLYELSKVKLRYEIKFERRIFKSKNTSNKIK